MGTKKTEDLVAVALKKEPIYIGIEERFLLLFTFLKKNRNKKVMVFFSSCMAVKFYHELLNYIDLPVMCIHGKQKQTKRTTTFFQYCGADKGILLCTDVAARGLDIPEVDWIVQFDPPDDPKEYIHRVGRTARGSQGRGHALLFLLPEELGFLRYLKHAKVPLNEYDFAKAKISNIQLQLEKLIEKNFFLHKSAKDGYRSYLQSYASHQQRTIFDVRSLDLQKVAQEFGFRTPPSVNLNVSAGGKSAPTKKKSGALGQRHGDKVEKSHKFKNKFAAKGGGTDGRQFSR